MEIVGFLFEKGARVDVQDRWGNTPLSEASGGTKKNDPRLSLAVSRVPFVITYSEALFGVRYLEIRKLLQPQLVQAEEERAASLDSSRHNRYSARGLGEEALKVASSPKSQPSPSAPPIIVSESTPGLLEGTTTKGLLTKGNENTTTSKIKHAKKTPEPVSPLSLPAVGRFNSSK